MSAIEIKVDTRGIRDIQRALAQYPKQAPRMLARALNKVASAAKKIVSSRLRQATTLKTASIKKRIGLSKATAARLMARLYLGTYSIGAHSFSVRQTRSGVSFRWTKRSPRRLTPHAFIARGRGGVKLVFRRAGVGNRLDQNTAVKPSAGRLPIVAQKGPSLQELFRADQTVQTAVKKQIRVDLDRAVNRAIRDFFWAKRKQ